MKMYLKTYANWEGPDQAAHSAVWSGPSLFADRRSEYRRCLHETPPVRRPIREFIVRIYPSFPNPSFYFSFYWLVKPHLVSCEQSPWLKIMANLRLHDTVLIKKWPSKAIFFNNTIFWFYYQYKHTRSYRPSRSPVKVTFSLSYSKIYVSPPGKRTTRSVGLAILHDIHGTHHYAFLA